MEEFGRGDGFDKDERMREHLELPEMDPNPRPSTASGEIKTSNQPQVPMMSARPYRPKRNAMGNINPPQRASLGGYGPGSFFHMRNHLEKLNLDAPNSRPSTAEGGDGPGSFFHMRKHLEMLKVESQTSNQIPSPMVTSARSDRPKKAIGSSSRQRTSIGGGGDALPQFSKEHELRGRSQLREMGEIGEGDGLDQDERRDLPEMSINGSRPSTAGSERATMSKQLSNPMMMGARPYRSRNANPSRRSYTGGVEDALSEKEYGLRVRTLSKLFEPISPDELEPETPRTSALARGSYEFEPKNSVEEFEIESSVCNSSDEGEYFSNEDSEEEEEEPELEEEAHEDDVNIIQVKSSASRRDGGQMEYQEEEEVIECFTESEASYSTTQSKDRRHRKTSSMNNNAKESRVKTATKFSGENTIALFSAPDDYLASSNDCVEFRVEDFVFYKPMTLPNGDSLMDVDLNSVINDPGGFAMLPVPPGMIVKCRITRDRGGINKNYYPYYYLHLELDDGKKVPILGARKRKKTATSSYVISKDPTDLSRHSPNCLGKLRSTLRGLNFTLYDNGLSPKKHGVFADFKERGDFRQELLSINYGPRKMKFIIPRMVSQTKRAEIRPICSRETIRKKVKNDELEDVVELVNKKPFWHHGSQSYVLNFRGRVTVASVKNFQIIHPDNDKYIIMQFGRVGENIFSLDFSFPLCPLQAFGICLSAFDDKYACQ